MNDLQIRIIRALQNGLLLCREPLDEIARSAGVSVEELLRQLGEWQSDGTIRRFGAMLRHRQAGYEANAMVVWDVPDDRIEEFASAAVSMDNVSHCYQRPVFPEFAYNIYTMVHGKTEAEVEATATAIAEKCGIERYKLLYTTEEFKKSSPVYFTSSMGTET